MKSARVRAFLAVELPPETKRVLAELIGQLVRVRVNGVRPVETDGMHLTVKFLGDITVEQAEAVVSRMCSLAESSHAFELVLGNVGAFPSSRSPRVLWIGLEGDTGPLREMHSLAETLLEDLGFKKEGRPFHPHLTLARVGDRATPIDRRRITEALFSAEVKTGHAFGVDGITLMRSILRPEGAHYDRLAHVSFKAE